MYNKVGLNLSQSQSVKLAKAIHSEKPITIRLSKDQYKGPHIVYLTTRQLNEITKNAGKGVGTALTFSVTQLKANVKSGSGFFGDLIRSGGNWVIDKSIDGVGDLAKDALKGGLKKITGGCLISDKQAKQLSGKGFFSDIAGGLANAAIDVGSGALKTGVKTLVGGNVAKTRKRKTKKTAGYGIIPPGC